MKKIEVKDSSSKKKEIIRSGPKWPQSSEERKSPKFNMPEKTEIPHERNDNVQKMLIENFVGLQSVMADLSSKLNNLANQMSKLLELFEESAKTFMEKDIKLAGGPDKETADKLDKLLEQNKIIARGLALLHESNASVPEDTGYAPMSQPQFTQQTPQQQAIPIDPTINRYQRSITSR